MLLTPPAAPERIARLALALTRGVGCVTFARLMVAFGSPAAVLSASPISLQTVRGVGSQIAAEIHAIDQARLDRLAADLKRWQANRITLTLWGDGEYPAALADLSDAPLAIFMRGMGILDNRPARDCQRIALVGTREPTAESIALTTDLARAFADRGWTIVSGLARGVDSAAHHGTLAASGGRTVAVLGSGIVPGAIYPPENRSIADRIAARGVLLCECPPDSSPSPKYLTLRNRLITGLSRVVVVIEAGATSGALHAARHASRQGRLICAVPNGSAGNETLIANGAHPIRAADDVWRALAETS